MDGMDEVDGHPPSAFPLDSHFSLSEKYSLGVNPSLPSGLTFAFLSITVRFFP